jgi:hypothetical protein
MAYYLPRHIYCRVMPYGVVLLDARHNRYYGLSKNQAASLAPLVANWPEKPVVPIGDPGHESKSVDRLAKLVEGGILTTSDPGPQIESADPPRPVGSVPLEIIREWAGIVGLKQIAKFCWATVYIIIRLRLQNLDSLIRALRSGGQLRAANHQRVVPEAAIIALVATHYRLRPWMYISKDSCLFDSLVLFQYLRLNGIPATLVVGVKFAPFAAHCWVQVGLRVLNNQPEDLDCFEPIVVVNTGA